MKHFLHLFLLINLSCFGQNFHLEIAGNNKNETKIIDSIGYKKKLKEEKLIINELENLTKELQQIGFIENRISSQSKLNDSINVVKYNLGKRTDFIHIYIGKDDALRKLIFEKEKDTIIIPFTKTELFLKESISKLEKKGYSLAKLQLVNFRKSDSNLICDLVTKTDKVRKLDEIVIKGFEKFPIGFKKNIERNYKKKAFNQEHVKKINSDFDKIRFVKQLKYPEILFTKDSTKVFVYLDKSNSNTFDGFIGFGNNEENKIKFNGYLDLNLVNLLKSGETFMLNWKSDGNNQKTFNASLELPYIFKSPLGIKGQLNIFKQDSTFQNTKTAIDLGYYFSSNSKLFLGYQSSESNDIQNANSSLLNDFNNSFFTTNYDFSKTTPRDNYDALLFPEKTKIWIKTGFGNRATLNSTEKQFFTEINLKNNFYLNERNSISIKSQNFFLQSDNYIINELYRFGGVNSIRGFNENSLQGSFFSSILTEYRYTISQSLYTHSVIDYGYYQDKTSKTNGNLYGLGFGIGLLTKNGLFNLLYANGSSDNQAIKLSNSVIHISLKTNF
ncbi:MAG: hypothetical protein O9267_07210 [Flavobacterium sp.]|nr:hypothetical protein [Flavobacterium sp.]